MLDYKECLNIIEAELKNVVPNDVPAELYQPIRYVLSTSGKRMRPCLLLMACNIFTDNIKEAIKPALAIETFHNFTLLHDDIMDNAVLRRNKPAVHVKWDTPVAILSGDAMMIKSYELLLSTKSGKVIELFTEFNNAALKVCEGQQYDMNYEKRLDVTVNEYLNMIKLKTSALIAGSLKIGAIIGNASEQDQQLVYDFGLNLGIGFQLQDDLLDAFGDSATFGKKIGGDIVANKKTFLLLTALAEAKGETYKRLKKLITSYEVSREQKIKQVLEIYNELKIKEKTEEKITQFFNKSIENLDNISADKKRKQKMRGLVDDLFNRLK